MQAACVPILHHTTHATNKPGRGRAERSGHADLPLQLVVRASRARAVCVCWHPGWMPRLIERWRMERGWWWVREMHVLLTVSGTACARATGRVVHAALSREGSLLVSLRGNV